MQKTRNFKLPHFLSNSGKKIKGTKSTNYHLFYSTKYPLKALYSMTLPPEPSCYSMVVSNPHWRAAIGSEFDAFIRGEIVVAVNRFSINHFLLDFFFRLVLGSL